VNPGNSCPRARLTGWCHDARGSQDVFADVTPIADASARSMSALQRRHHKRDWFRGY